LIRKKKNKGDNIIIIKGGNFFLFVNKKATKVLQEVKSLWRLIVSCLKGLECPTGRWGGG